jgi:hypothetical protein
MTEEMATTKKSGFSRFVLSLYGKDKKMSVIITAQIIPFFPAIITHAILNGKKTIDI